MPGKRLLLGGSLLIAGLAWLALVYDLFERGGVRIPTPDVQAVFFDPYDTPLLRPYGRHRDALLHHDTAALKELLEAVPGSYLEYRTLRTLADDTTLALTERAAYFRRALELRIDDPLARNDTRALWLEYAQLAERARLVEEATAGYTQALPRWEAVNGLKRLETNPYRLANIFLEARQYQNALNALDGHAAPSIEAPAYRALGEYQKALEAYERWLLQEPESETALLGRAWSLFYLGENGSAEAAFAALSDPSALYGRGILALRAGEVDDAVRLYRASGVPRNLWWATDLLEERGRAREAIPIYLELAELDSEYAAEAAYRALVLAERYDDEPAAARAAALLPAHSYLGLRRGGTLELPQSSSLPEVQPAVLELANALATVDDLEAAVGELLFALREAEDEATAIAIAERLQLFGEFRQSQRAAVSWLNRGSQELRTWQLAYPRAYPDIVMAEASAWDIEPALVWAIMRQESSFYPRAVSVSNAQGLMQVIPSTWTWLAGLLKESPGDPFAPEDNIRYGTYYLRWLLNYLEGDLELVVPAYNGGQGYIRRLFNDAPIDGDKNEFYRFIDKPETRDYLQKVMLNYEIYRALYPQDPKLAGDPQ